MKYRVVFIVLMALGTGCVSLSQSIAAEFAVADLRTEFRVNPLGIDEAQPRLSWILDIADQKEQYRNLKQSAYHVLVASHRQLLERNKGDLWDSGKVATDQSALISYAGRPLVSRMTCYWKIRAWNTKDKASDWSQTARWTMGMLTSDDWQAKWILGPHEDPKVAQWMRKSFSLSQVPQQAHVMMNILGYAELYINGQKVGSDVLTPATSDFNRRNFYITYDVTPHLQKGKNAMGVWLARGWAGSFPNVRLQLDAKVGGQAFTLGTDATWKCKASNYQWIGKREWNNFGGERLDAQADNPDWCKKTFDDRHWGNAKVVPGPGGESLAQKAPLNRIGRRIPATAVTDWQGGTFLIDFGMNLTGWLKLRMPLLKAGTVVEMTFADRIDRKRPQHFNQVSEFVSGGKSGEVFEHKFNYAGFRYVIVSGLPSAPAREDAIAMLVESDLEEAGAFECSSKLFNDIHQLTRWTQRCLNLGGYYVDCPHRERMGYGDGQVAVEGFMMNFRSHGFYRKWLCDWRIRQTANGKLPHMAPFGSGGGGPAWPGLLAAITWRHYLYYGDIRVLEENYDAIRRYVDYLETLCKDDILRKIGEGKWSFIGDWVPPRRGMDTKNWPCLEAAELFNNCYRVYQWGLLARMAKALGRQEEAARCRERISTIRPAIHAAFYDSAKKQYVIDEQPYYIMPLMTGVTPDSEKTVLLKKLEQNIMDKNKGHLDSGMLGTYFMMEYLREIGRNDLIFTMLNQTTYPGWGHMLEQGATTCWEQWNGHWSRIHSCFTSPDNWFYQGLGGIQPDASAPGFEKIIIKPAIVGDLTWVRTHHDSPYGRIISNWKIENGSFTWDISVPANSTATVYLPAKDRKSIREGSKSLSEAKGVTFLRTESGRAVLSVDSGHYSFVSKLHLEKPNH